MRAVDDWRPPKARRISVYSFFCPKSDGRKDSTASSPIATALRAVSPNYMPTIRLTFGWLLHSPMQQEPSNCEAPSPSLFFLFVALFAARNDGYTSSPTRSARSHRLSNAPPPTDTIVRLVVAYLHQEAATQDRCSAHLSIFPWGPSRRPKQGDQTQRAQARAPGASIRLMGSRGAAIRFRGGCRHGEGGQSRWWYRWVAAAHLCCVWWSCVLGEGPKLGFP